MVDDVFRGRAVIVDQMTPALRTIREEWARFNRGMQLGAARREVDGLRGSLRTIGNEITGATLPALSRFGLAGGGVALAVVGIAGAVKNYSERIQDLGNASRELGLSARNIRAFEYAAGNVRIAPDAALEGLQTFKRNAEDFQLRIGGLRDELRKLGAGDVVEGISKAREPIEQMRVAFARMEELQKRNPAVARRFAEAMFGSAAFARMGWEEFRKSFERVGDLTDADREKAEKLNRAFLDLGASVEKLKQSAAVELIPGLTKAVDAATTLVDGMNKLDTLAEKWTGRKGGVYGSIFGHPMGEEAEKPPIDPMGSAKDYGMSEGDVRRNSRSQRPGDWRLPGFRLDRQKDETKEGTKQGTLEGLTEFFQRTGASGNAGGFMNAALGGTTGTLPSGGMGRWGGGGYELKGLGGGASNGQAIPAPSPGGGSGGNLPGAIDRSGAEAPPAGSKADNAQRIYAELRRLGHSHEQASAALGHAQHESGFNPSVRGDAGTAYGFWQHRGSRWALAQKMAREAGTSPYSPEQAARHFDYELRHGEKAAGSRYFSSKSTSDAVTALNGYERFAGWQRGQPGRYSSAEKFAQRMRDVATAGDTIDGKPVTDADRDLIVGGGGGTFSDRWNDRIDGALGGRNMGSATGTVNLNVTAPAGTKVEGKSDGMFKEMSIKRYRQMSESDISQGGGE